MVAYVDLARKSITNSVAQGFLIISFSFRNAFIEIASQTDFKTRRFG